MNNTELIQAAYWAGFEPSADELTEEQLFNEAEQYLFCLAFE